MTCDFQTWNASMMFCILLQNWIFPKVNYKTTAETEEAKTNSGKYWLIPEYQIKENFLP